MLVGTAAKVPSIDTAVICDACARCSLEFFVSAEPVKRLALDSSIGSWAGILGADETRTSFCLRSVVRNLPEPTQQPAEDVFERLPEKRAAPVKGPDSWKRHDALNQERTGLQEGRAAATSSAKPRSEGVSPVESM